MNWSRSMFFGFNFYFCELNLLPRDRIYHDSLNPFRLEYTYQKYCSHAVDGVMQELYITRALLACLLCVKASNCSCFIVVETHRTVRHTWALATLTLSCPVLITWYPDDASLGWKLLKWHKPTPQAQQAQLAALQDIPASRKPKPGHHSVLQIHMSSLNLNTTVTCISSKTTDTND